MLKKLTISAVVIAACVVCLLGISASADFEEAYVAVDALNLRNNPSFFADTIEVVYIGEKITVIQEYDEWSEVNYNGKLLYASNLFITQDPELVPYEEYKPVGTKVIEYSKNFLGIPYRYGGNGPNSFDCSGFVKYVYAGFGVDLPRTTYSMLGVGTRVSKQELIPGDLVFFNGGGHVGLYVGNNTYIHAPETGRTVSIDDMSHRTLYAARRIFN